MTTYKHSVTTIHSKGGTDVGYMGVVTDDNLTGSIEGARAMLSREAQLNANILSVEEAQNTLVVIYNNGMVKAYKWLKNDE
jgi:hypothetical protein